MSQEQSASLEGNQALDMGSAKKNGRAKEKESIIAEQECDGEAKSDMGRQRSENRSQQPVVKGISETSEKAGKEEKDNHEDNSVDSQQSRGTSPEGVSEKAEKAENEEEKGDAHDSNLKQEKLETGAHGIPRGLPKGRCYPKFDYYAVLDFECTCEEKPTTLRHEIIEFPVLFLNAHTLKIDFQFHRFVRPVENPKLTPFCTKLTGIQQQSVDGAELLGSVLKDFHAFLEERSLVWARRRRGPDSPLFALCSDGNWDIRKFLQPESHRKKLDLEPYWSQWIDVRRIFAEAHGCARCGIADMLDRLNLTFDGRPHSGLDDARNIARIVEALLRKGARVSYNF